MRTLLSLALLLPAIAALAAPPEVELRTTEAVAVIDAKPGPPATLKDYFGPGRDGVNLGGRREAKSRLQWTVPPGLPAGNYVVGLLVAARTYLAFSEFYTHQIPLYHNDTWAYWQNHSAPVHPEQAADARHYQAEMTTGVLPLKPGDSLMAVFAPDGANLVVGPLRIYRQPPTDGVQELGVPGWGKPMPYWLEGKMLDPQREGNAVTQGCELYHPGALPRALNLRVQAVDYLQRVLLDKTEAITLQPNERRTLTWSFTRPDRQRCRFTVTASAEGVAPPLRLVRYLVDDVVDQPRPTFCLNGEWEMCFVPGAEPGSAPPADSKWQKISVPSLQPNKDGHCAWYRRSFDAPPYLTGDRILLSFDQAMTEAWVYVNGQAVGHELHGSQPFTVDITAAYRPGQRHDVLVAVRDWIAYSPANQERVKAGEEPVYKDRMTDVAGYSAAANVGLGGPVTLQARPAVTVDDVFIVTSVRNKKLTLRYRLRNDTAQARTATLAPVVLDAGKAIKSLGPVEVQLPPRQTVLQTVEAPWPNARYWWPEAPYLYGLQTDLTPATGTADRRLDRFGFREMWIEGIAFVLNGTRVKLRSQWSGGAASSSRTVGQADPARRLESLWEWQMRSVYFADVQLARTHGQAGVREVCDVADEVGLMVKLESECNQVNFTFDQRFWNAVLAHELHVMDTYKNYASVNMWSAGNENMWGWIYQGEAAKVLGNRWQVKIVKTMREFDLMRRPIEWEADGDLMGGWEHHALHYPRELEGHPDVPEGAFWGPLDGKTVVPYSMGPITLGEKPLTVGEAFWPATLHKPYGASIIVGDATYANTVPYGRAWNESSQFFVNGFRDVEFALIDIYNTLSLIPPQTVVLKQEDRSFYGGTTVTRDVNVHNDVRRPANLTLRWALVGAGSKAGASLMLKLAPAELKRLKLEVPLPTVRQPTVATLKLELLDEGRLVHTETRDWRLSPPLKLQAPPGLKLAVCDPVGDTAAMLKRVGLPFTPVAQLQAPAEGALLLGRDALKQPPEGPWREELIAFVRGGGKLVILEQSQPPDFLPTPLATAKDRKTTLAYPRATDHPLLQGLAPEDFWWWAPDHNVSIGNYRKPSAGNCLPLVDVGTGEGILETPLLEEYEGQGSIILCQMLLTDKVGVAPPAGVMLQNLLNYLAAPEPFRRPANTALFAGADAPLRKALDDSRLACDDLTGKAEELLRVGASVSDARVPEDRRAYAVAIVDAASALDDALVPVLRSFAEAGGHVLLHRVTPERQKQAEAALGARLRLFPLKDEPDDIQIKVIRSDNVGLLAGVSNHELFWGSNAFLAVTRHEGNWWSHYYGGAPAAEYIADCYCSPADADAAQVRQLTRPGALLQAPCGKGYVALSQFRLDQPVADCAVTVARLRSLLLTNLGSTLRSSGGAQLARKQRLQRYDFFTVDLGPYANRGLKDDKAAGIVGWTNQGENDMRALPTGRQTFEGIPFQIASPKAAITLYSTNAANTDLPREVKGLKIGQRADVLFFLHSMAWGCEKPFVYRVNYEDGTTVEVPIVLGRQIMDWWDDPIKHADSLARGGGFIAWTGANPMRPSIVLPACEWTNPHPEKVIRDVDFVKTPDSDGCVPVLAGITGAISRPREGIVTDVIGTAGLKVQLGTQVQDIYYIGCEGLPPDHPYYPQAMAAHRDMVVGKKVSILDDVVTENAAGQRIAYVAIGDIYYAQNLVNGKLIGEGLAKLGNFEGNARHRMFLDNLGFIAKQRKAGLWGVK